MQIPRFVGEFGYLYKENEDVYQDYDYVLWILAFVH